MDPHSAFHGHVDHNVTPTSMIDYHALVVPDDDDHYRDMQTTDMLRHQRQHHPPPSLPWPPAFDLGAPPALQPPVCLPLCGQGDGDDDDDCASDCSATCDRPCASQCGDVVCCDDDACESSELCRDEACQDRPCMDENCRTDRDDAAAAAVLTSFGDNSQLPMMSYADHTLQQFMPCASLSTMLTLPDGSSCFPNQPCNMTMEYALANHIAQYHDPSYGLAHANKCVANDPAQVMPRCTLPKMSLEDNQYLSSLSASECGFQVQDPSAFADHIFEDHLPVLEYHQAAVTLPAITRPPPAPPPPHMIHHDQQHFSPSSSPLTTLSGGPALSATPSSLTSFAAPSPLESIATRSLSPPAAGSVALAQEDQFTCRWIDQHGSICGRRFDNDEQLQKHCKLDHLKPLRKARVGFRCGWANCTRSTSFSQRSKLERHMQVHTGYKPVHCDVCGAALSAKQALEQHKRIHTGETPWLCKFPDCGCAFKQQSALTMHERTHTGLKPLKCEICFKRFSESSNLSKHRRTHNVKGLHECKICGKDFHRLDQLRRHVSTNHKDQHAELDALFGRAKPRYQATLKVTKPIKTVASKTVLQPLDSGAPVDQMLKWRA
ncbi:hypothetical protein L249_3465 [Ophiocordyceps polyrhachis-furcata BCC 54312]|uniref:C2H2-type domain-containing protein n=1 Tax=Ophiocordyceps polyrhachis-furcata BCC 54312 TaxID=1330021 RepID=A0A367LLX8_9HYPO|nr:hypothetical protein L249_3465 [Ophiocordyceps polyrhachis-furcata BCC 54312]